MTRDTPDDEEDPLVTPLLSDTTATDEETFSATAQQGGDTPATAWDFIFDKHGAAPIGLETHGHNSTQVLRVQPGSQAERLGLGQALHGGNLYIIAINGKPVYSIQSILKAVQKCREEQDDFLANSLIFTLSRHPRQPPPVYKPCWTCTKYLVTRCVPKPNRRILTYNNGKFLGLCGPARHVQRCFLCCKNIRLETIVFWLAWLLLLKSVAFVVYFLIVGIVVGGDIYEMWFSLVGGWPLARAMVDAGLTLYLLRGIVSRSPWALQRFALMLFVQVVTYMIVEILRVLVVGIYSSKGEPFFCLDAVLNPFLGLEYTIVRVVGLDEHSMLLS